MVTDHLQPAYSWKASIGPETWQFVGLKEWNYVLVF